MVSPGAVLTSVRNKRPFLDHLIRAFGRYQADAGDRQAAAVTFFGFLSFFPLIALATSLLSYVLGDEAIGTVVREVNSYAPGLAGQLELEKILTDNRKAGATGLLGLAGLLYAGLGWVDALREAIRTVWHHNVKEGNLVVKKVKDVVVLAGLGVAVVLSVGISAATGAFTGFALDVVGLEKTFVATAIAKVVGVTLGLATSTGLFLYLFWRLPKVQSPFRRVVKGALLAGLLFEVLKRVGAVYIERTTENPVYGAFAVIVGLLVWINIVSRMLLFCAAWTVTQPYDSDIEPSGTASVEAAREADIPTEFADNDPDDPPTIQQDGAPSPLAAAVQGAAPQPDDPSDGPARAGASAGTTSSYASISPAPVGLSSPAAPAADRTQVVVRQAAQFTAGALGMVVTAVLIHVLRTVRGLVRR
ncbi:MAG: YihY/virulence factor BrkB family protein [Actinobacteria bacterium]|nr:YihY/virulence factor BrkB family protein [Actinomycetota bacterium]MBW3647138.1 YihY/virulence factor BrkB family protein [Actinomycetota bacterium]